MMHPAPLVPDAHHQSR